MWSGKKTPFLSWSAQKKSTANVAATQFEHIAFLFGCIARNGLKKITPKKKHTTEMKNQLWNFCMLCAEKKGEESEWVPLPFSEWHLLRIYIVLFSGPVFFPRFIRMHFFSTVSRQFCLQHRIEHDKFN